jgi:hypothetical protein
MKKNISKFVLIFVVLTLGIGKISAQGNLETVKVYSRAAFTEWFDKTSSYSLKKIHSVVIDSWNYNANTGRYLIIVMIKWEDVGVFNDDTYENTFTLKCDTDGCNANIKPDGKSLFELECIEK